MFLSIEELVDQAKAYSSVAELMIAVEMEMSGRSRSQIIAIMEKNLSVMEQSINEGKKVSPPSQGLPVAMQKN